MIYVQGGSEIRICAFNIKESLFLKVLKVIGCLFLKPRQAIVRLRVLVVLGRE